MRQVGLSGKEIRVISLIAGGYTNEQISTKLHININTVKAHVRAILDTLHARNRTEAAAIWIKQRMEITKETALRQAHKKGGKEGSMTEEEIKKLLEEIKSCPEMMAQIEKATQAPFPDDVREAVAKHVYKACPYIEMTGGEEKWERLGESYQKVFYKHADAILLVLREHGFVQLLERSQVVPPPSGEPIRFNGTGKLTITNCKYNPPDREVKP